MNVILFENNPVSNLFFNIVEKFHGRYGKNLCLYYDLEKSSNHKRFIADDEYIKKIRFFVDDLEVHDGNIYLLNLSKLSITEVFERLSKYVFKIVIFNDNDFAEIKKYCKSIAKKMGSGKLDNLDDYVEYVRSFNIDKYFKANTKKVIMKRS